MQLILLAVIIMLCGGDRQNFNRIKPIIEELGGAEAAEAIGKAEELGKVISAVKDIQNNLKADGPNKETAPHSGGAFAAGGESEADFPLSPVANIADERIACALSRYIAMGE